MKDSPLISIIIPAYNHEKYVQEAILAAVAQSYKNLELIVIDDGSKDSTFQKIKELQQVCEKRFVRFVCRTKPNGGTVETFNELIKEAKGELIGLCASDDKFTPNAITDLYNYISDKPDVGLVFGKNLLMDSNSRECYWNANQDIVYEKSKAKYLSFTDMLKRVFPESPAEFGSYASLCRGNYIGNGYLFRKSIFEKIGPFTKAAPLEDFWMMLQFSKHCKLRFIDVPTFYYRWHAANSIKQKKRINDIAFKTFLYEKSLLEKTPEYAKFIPIFEKNTAKTKSIINILNIFALSKTKGAFEKSISVKFFGIHRKVYIKKHKNS